MITISARDAQKKKLPAVGLTINTSGTAFLPTLFPQAHRYVIFSGPPGGAEGLSIDAVVADGSETALKELAKVRIGDVALENAVFGSVMIAGIERPALVCSEGGGPFKSTHLYILIPLQEKALLIDAWSSAIQSGTPPHELLSKLMSAPLIHSLQVTTPAP